MAYGKVESGPMPSKNKRLSLFSTRKTKGTDRTYIVPTRFGMGFGVMAFILLMMAMGYGNNLIYLYAFSLVSLAFCSMYVTNENIRRLKIQSVQATELYAGETGELRIAIQNTSKSFSENLEFSIRHSEPRKAVDCIEGNEGYEVHLPWTPEFRGVQPMPRIRMESLFPFEILRSWKIYRSDKKIIVYPKKEGSTQLPVNSSSGEALDLLGLFRDHRNYQSTDSPKHIDWRASAKQQELLVRNFESSGRRNFMFNWEHTDHIKSFEEKISQLALWIYLAEQQEMQYGLKIEGSVIVLSSGYEHYKSCMEKLATLHPEELA